MSGSAGKPPNAIGGAGVDDAREDRLLLRDWPGTLSESAPVLSAGEFPYLNGLISSSTAVPPFA